MIYIDRPDGSSEPLPTLSWRARVRVGDQWQWIGNMAPPDDEQQSAPDPEPATPALPERTEPPGIEWRSNTERTQEIARRLIESVFSEGE